VKGVPFVNRLYMKGVPFLSKMVNKGVRERLRGIEVWGGAFPYNTTLSFPRGLTYLGSEVDNFGIQCFNLSFKMNVVISSSFKAQECIIQLDSNLPYLARKILHFYCF